MNEWLGIVGVAGALGGMMLGVRALQRRAWVGPEVARKIVHVVMGLVCAAFPWIFREAWPVVLLGGLTMAGLAAVRRVPALRGKFGGVLGGVDRTTRGEFYFVAAAMLGWIGTGGDPFVFTTSMGVLALADAAGALVGQRWGRHPYGAGEGRKTLEGSLAVGLVAFLCLCGAIAWLRPAAGTTIVVTAGLITLAAVLAEAIGTNGSDNLLLPLTTGLLLRRCQELEPAELAWRLAGMAVIAGFFFGWARWDARQRERADAAANEHEPRPSPQPERTPSASFIP